jgi:hypothetical protein
MMKRATSPPTSPPAIAPRFTRVRAGRGVGVGVVEVVVEEEEEDDDVVELVVVLGGGGGGGDGVGAPDVIDGVPAANAPIPEAMNVPTGAGVPVANFAAETHEL